MNILFVHRTFPGQFEHLIFELLKDSNNEISFITNNDKATDIEGVKKYIYRTEKTVSDKTHSFLQYFEQSVIHAEAAANVALKLKQDGLKPDIIYGFSGWGSSMFMKDVFPKVPFLCYFGWYVQPENSVYDFDGTILTEEDRQRIDCNNAHLMMNLCNCDAGITETNWQKQQIPKDFHHKIKVIHNGINTNICTPDKKAKFIIKDKNLELTSKDEVITYGTRGMEPFRGFPQFMEAIDKVLKRRPNAHIVIAGEDVVCYSPKLSEGTYKELMLKKLNLDMSRVHFTGALPFEDYIKLLQISSVHVYLTYPFVLSWSLLNALATECCVIASNTAPIIEVIKDNKNGLLVDFFDTDAIAEKIEYALNNQSKMKMIRQNARKTILENYDTKNCLLKQIKYIQELIKK